jgi:alginate O-acetyltransferase complex protein AlgI
LLFNSLIFLGLFLPLTLLGFSLAGRRFGAVGALTSLAIASLFFYGWWDVRMLPLLLGSVAGNFLLGMVMDIRRGVRGGKQSGLFALGVIGNLGLIGWFKYSGFLAMNIAWATGVDLGWHVLLPLGISFFTFQQIAYLGGIHSGGPAETSPLRYLVFVTFFAHLIAGPIVHPAEILPQLAKIRTRLTPWNLVMGGSLFAMGLAKKVLLADTLAHFSAPAFVGAEHGIVPDLINAWGGLTAYTLQIYFDFSGYSDMAMGLALLFGLRFPVNFFSPYKATSIIDFWRRWHMTLSRFLRDYLYVPFGGNRKGPVRRYGNLLATMLIGGLWHGASWTFVIWGALHGIYLIINHLWRGSRLGTIPAFVGWGLTLPAVMMAWVVFRADTVSGAWVLYQGLAGQNGVTIPAGVMWRLGSLAPILSGWGVTAAGGDTFQWLSMIVWTSLGFAIAVLAPNSVQIFRASALHDPHDRPSPLSWHANWHWALAVGALVALSLLQLGSPSQFIYFNF